MYIWQFFTYVRKSNTDDGAKEPMRSENKTKQTRSMSIPKLLHTYTGTYQKKIKPYARAYQQVHGYRNTGCNTYKYTGTHRTDGIHIICTGIHTKYTGTATRVAPNLARAHIDPFLIPLSEIVAQATKSHEESNFIVHGHQTDMHNSDHAKQNNFRQQSLRNLSARF